MRLFLILISFFGLNVFAKISPEELAKVEELKVKAATGDAAALCDLGFRYIRSDGVPRDTLKGIEMMKQSAEKGYFPAENNLSEWYMTGLVHNGVTFIKKNWGEMYKWCKKSADQKSIYGFYLHGMYFSKNPEECSKPGGYTEAIKWFRLAAENGWVAAQYELGNLYSPNPNIPDRKYPPAVNREESAKWFLLAAMRGHIKAQVKMGGIMKRELASQWIK
jgi:TPR repeat protein